MSTLRCLVMPNGCEHVVSISCRFVLLMWLALAGEPIAAQSDSPPSAPAANTPAASADGTGREAEKQRQAMAGLLALCGILIGGLMFVAVVMIWGARLRRMARTELPAQKTLEKDLWFLKPPKSPPE